MAILKITVLPYTERVKETILPNSSLRTYTDFLLLFCISLDAFWTVILLQIKNECSSLHKVSSQVLFFCFPLQQSSCSPFIFISGGGVTPGWLRICFSFSYFSACMNVLMDRLKSSAMKHRRNCFLYWNNNEEQWYRMNTKCMLDDYWLNIVWEMHQVLRNQTKQTNLLKHFFCGNLKNTVEYVLFNISSMKKFYQQVFAIDLHKQITN